MSNTHLLYICYEIDWIELRKWSVHFFFSPKRSNYFVVQNEVCTSMYNSFEIRVRHSQLKGKVEYLLRFRIRNVVLLFTSKMLV